MIVGRKIPHSKLSNGNPVKKINENVIYLKEKSNCTSFSLYLFILILLPFLYFIFHSTLISHLFPVPFIPERMKLCSVNA